MIRDMNSSFLSLVCLNLTRAVNFDVLSLIWSHFNSLTIQLIYFILFFFYFYRKSVACRVKLLDVQAKISAIIISCLIVLWCFRRLLVNNVWVVGLCGISKSRLLKTVIVGSTCLFVCHIFLVFGHIISLFDRQFLVSVVVVLCKTTFFRKK